MLRFSGVSKAYGNKTVVPPFDLTVNSGEVLVLLGPERLREDDDPANGRGPGEGHFRENHGRRPRADRSQPARRDDGDSVT